MRTIWFDMDGTIADLYAVDNWLTRLRSFDPSPYTEARTMLNMSLLARYLNKVQAAGYCIGIISWLSMDSTEEYEEAVIEAKMSWLEEHLHSVHFDSINMVSYGISKNEFMENEDDILFDDNENIRKEWTGEAHEPNNIIEVLKQLLRDE